MKLPLHTSLKFRIASIIFVLEAIMMGVVLWQVLGHSGEAIRKQFNNNDQAMLDILSGVSRTALLTEEYADFQPYLENLLETSRIEQALLIDSRGLIVASTNPAEVGKAPTHLHTATEQHTADTIEHFWRSKEITNSAGLLGIIAIEISNEALSEVTVESRNLGIVLAIIGMIIIAIVGLVAGVLLTRRLATVTTTANRFAHGDLAARTGMEGQDEIAELGMTFDRMAANLQTAQNEGEVLIKQLSSKNAQLERFTYTVSHDLKTPLVTVRGFVGVLEKDLAEGNADGVKKDLEHIMSATSTMGHLLEDLLKLSQIGHVINDPQPVKLTEIFEAAAGDLQALIDEQAAELEIQPDMPTVMADRLRLQEVAQNLLHNALKFSVPGKPAIIRVSAKEQADGVSCCVEDQGIGIDPEYHDLIFGLFNRLDQSIEGTGIGLSLVKSIIEAHQGTIKVESNGDGTGAKFYFTVPAAVDSGTDAPSPQQ